MKWKKEFAKNGVEYQIDTVGNIYQQHGGVIPKACQKCKKKFKSKLKTIPVIENVPIYKCASCSFENPNTELAFEHKLLFDKHKINKTTKSRIVDTRRIITGELSHIRKTKNDVFIFCGECA